MKLTLPWLNKKRVVVKSPPKEFLDTMPTVEFSLCGRRFFVFSGVYCRDSDGNISMLKDSDVNYILDHNPFIKENLWQV